MARHSVELSSLGSGRFCDPRVQSRSPNHAWRSSGEPISAGQAYDDGSSLLPIQILRDDRLLLWHIMEHVQLETKSINPSDRALAERMGLFSTSGKETASSYSTARTIEQYAHSLGIPLNELVKSMSQLGVVLDMGSGLGGLATSWAINGAHRKTQIISADIRYSDSNFVNNILGSEEFKSLLHRIRAATSHLPPGAALKKIIDALSYFNDNSIACMAHHVPLPDNSVGGIFDLKAIAYCTDRYRVTPPRDYGYVLGEYIRLTTQGGLIAVNTLSQPAGQDSVGRHILNNTWNLPYQIVLETQVPQSVGTAVDRNFFLRVG